MGESQEDAYIKALTEWLGIRQQDQKASFISTSDHTNWPRFMPPNRTYLLDCGIVQFGARSSEQAAVCPEGRGTVVLIQKPNGDIVSKLEVVV